MNYSQALSYLDGFLNYEQRSVPIAGATQQLSNDGLVELLSVLGDPQASFRSIHITGTNGKGSVAHMTAAVLAATDLSVGLYSSPHLEKPNERMSWNGDAISDEDFARVVGLVASVMPMVENELTWFEAMTAVAIVWFSELAVDVAVVEVGLLGTYDATNVIDSDVAVITNIAKDHTDGAGNWKSLVATEKAGIIKPDSFVILGDDFGEEAELFESRPNRGVWKAHEDFTVDSSLLSVGGRLVDIQTPGQLYEDLFLPFHADYQAYNFAIALAATEAFFERVLDKEIIEFALTRIQIPARFEIVNSSPIVVLDGFHNEAAASSTVGTLEESFARLGSWVLIVGFLADRDPAEVLTAIKASTFDAVIVCEPANPRALDVQAVADSAKKIGVDVEVVRDPVDAYQRALGICAEEDLILVGGSFYILGDIRQTVFAGREV